MRRKDERDRQFLEGCRLLAEASPNSSVTGYDPNPYCCADIVNEDSKQDEPTMDAVEELQTKETELTDKPQSEQRDTSSICGGEPTIGESNIPGSDVKINTTVKKDANKDEYGCQVRDINDAEKGDAFGPWKNNTASEEDLEPFLLSHVYNFKLPSSLHNSGTENEYSSAYLDRHGIHHRYSNRYSDYFGPWKLQSSKPLDARNRHFDKKDEVSVIGRILEKQIQAQQKIMASHRNSWTFREAKHNLRIPCISNVIGFKNKTDAHTK